MERVEGARWPFSTALGHMGDVESRRCAGPRSDELSLRSGLQEGPAKLQKGKPS
jgi:hypothetical protein